MKIPLKYEAWAKHLAELTTSIDVDGRQHKKQSREVGFFKNATYNTDKNMLDFAGFRCQIVREATNTLARHFVFFFGC